MKLQASAVKKFQYSQKNTCVGVLFRSATSLKRDFNADAFL